MLKVKNRRTKESTMKKIIRATFVVSLFLNALPISLSAQCVEGGKCPREMVERLRKEKQEERKRLKMMQKYEIIDENTEEASAS